MPGETYQIDTIISVSVSVVVFSALFLAIIFIVWGGVMLILSGGKEEKIKPAISTIRFSVIGIIVVIISIAIAGFVTNRLNLEMAKYFDFWTIFDDIRRYGAYLFGNETSVVSGSDMQYEFWAWEWFQLDSDFTDL